MCFFLQMVKVFGKVLRTDALGRAEQWELSSGPKWKVKLGKRGGGRSPSGVYQCDGTSQFSSVQLLSHV